MDNQISPDVLQERIENLTTTVEEFKKDTKTTLADILGEVRGVAGRLTTLEAKQTLADNNFTEFKVSTNNSLDNVKKDTASNATAIEALKTSNLERNSEKNGVIHLWRTVLAAIGFIGLVTGTILYIISIIQKINGG